MNPTLPSLPFGTFSSLFTLYSFKSHPLSLCFWNLCFCERAIPTWNTSLYLPYSPLLTNFIPVFETQARMHISSILWSIPYGSVVKNPPATQETQETWVQSLGQEDPLEEEMANYSSILLGRTPWAEEPNGLHSIGSQRVRHD